MAIDDDFKDDLDKVSKNFAKLGEQSTKLEGDRQNITDIRSRIKDLIPLVCDNDQVKEVNKFFELTLFEVPKEADEAITNYNNYLSLWVLLY